MAEAPRRGRRPSPEKREALIAAALRALAAKGMDGSTTREIAADAGTTERTLFKHFGSKAGLMQAAMEVVSFEFVRLASFARIHDPAPFTASEFRDWHHAFLQERVASALTIPGSYRIIFAEFLRDPAFLDRYGERWLAAVFSPLAAHLQRMQESGEIRRASSPRALASAFFALNLGYLLSRFTLLPQGPWGPGDVDAVVALFAATCGSMEENPTS